MELFQMTTPAAVGEQAKALFNEERSEHKVLNGWLLCREISAQADVQSGETFPELRAAAELEAIVEQLPLELS